MNNAATGDRPIRRRVEAYAALVRLPNLFSAPPDVILGAALITLGGETVSGPTLVVLTFASVCLYAGGVVLNDYFDSSVDARERPERPIPSGRVSRDVAGALGGVLLVGGVALSLVGGLSTAGIAAALAVTVVLYDGVLKGTMGGFLAMGSARALNVLLGAVGASAAGGSGFDTPSTLIVPTVVGLYIALVTYMAANEATETSRSAVVAGAGGVVFAAVTALSTVVAVGQDLTESALALALVAAFLAWTGRALVPAYADPRPSTVGPAVGACVLGLVVLDAAFAAIAGVEWALSILAFLVPALTLSRAFDVS